MSIDYSCDIVPFVIPNIWHCNDIENCPNLAEFFTEDINKDAVVCGWRYDDFVYQLGKRGRLMGACWTKGDFCVYAMSQGHSGYCDVMANDRESLEEWSRDFDSETKDDDGNSLVEINEQDAILSVV